MEFLWFVFPCSMPGSFYHVEFMVRQVLQIGCGCWTNRFIIFTIHNSCWNLKQKKEQKKKSLTSSRVSFYILLYLSGKVIDDVAFFENLCFNVMIEIGTYLNFISYLQIHIQTINKWVNNVSILTFRLLYFSCV